jgi:hypothetical protein
MICDYEKIGMISPYLTFRALPSLAKPRHALPSHDYDL